MLPADWKQWAQRHGWTAVYVFMAVVDIVACLVFKDWMLGVAAVTMVAFAWLSYDAAA